MTIYEKAKQLGVCFKRVHEQHCKVWTERNKPAAVFDPMFYHNEMALAAAVDWIDEVEKSLKDSAAVLRRMYNESQDLQNKIRILEIENQNLKAAISNAPV